MKELLEGVSVLSMVVLVLGLVVVAFWVSWVMGGIVVVSLVSIVSGMLAQEEPS